MSQSSKSRDLAIQYLAQNLAPSQVAGVLGVTESAISQLMADEDFMKEVNAAKEAASAEDLKFDERLDEAESRVLENIERRIGMANMQQSLQAFRVLNGARRRKDARTHFGAAGSGVTVNIMLPTSMVPKYIMNSQSEIVEVEGKTMASATPNRVTELLAEQKAAALPAPEGVTQAIPTDSVKQTRALEGLTSLTQRPRMGQVKSVGKPALIDLI
jgi:transcriptional regulator with XRE-family HTH domain